MAGRLTLVQAVTASTPTYAMQTAKLPIHTCDSIDKINRNFLWGGSADRKKIHLINWENVCKPKDKGGLGIKKTADMNKAMLAKASWRAIQGDNGLWCQIYQAKYLKKMSLLDPQYKKPSNCSSTWASVSYGASLMRKGISWRIGDGGSAKFWLDNWSSLGILLQFATDGSVVDNDALVQDFWDTSGWDMTLLHYCLPTQVVNHISTIPISPYSANPDRLIWNSSSDGNFSVKSAYYCLTNQNSLPDCLWKCIWKFNIPPKLKIFAWLVSQGRLLTNVQRCKRSLTTDTSCQFCPGVPESMLHLLRDCPRAMKIWNTITIPSTIHHTYQMNWCDWLFANIQNKDGKWLSFDWKEIFILICWYIWKWRNKSIFDSHFTIPPNPAEIIEKFALEWIPTIKVMPCRAQCTPAVLNWEKPPLGQLKLNVDGTKTKDGLIGADGVIRDWTGKWIQGFTHKIGMGDILQAEIWGVFNGLKLALDLQIKNLVVECDSTTAVHLINGRDHDLHPLGTLITNCQWLMEKFDHCRLIHIYRERNIVADILAKGSILDASGLHILTDPPTRIVQVLKDDSAGIGRTRTSSSACNS